MNKNIMTVLGVLSVLVGGIYYAFLQDKNRENRLLVESALQSFALKADSIERSFINEKQLKPSSSQENLPAVESQQIYRLSTIVDVDRVTLKFLDGDEELANKTLVLIPYIEDELVSWQCLEGSIILRLRPKDCRLGKKIRLADL